MDSGPGIDADTHVGAGTGEVERFDGTVQRELGADQFGDRQGAGGDQGATAWKPSSRQDEAPTMFHSL